MNENASVKRLTIMASLFLPMTLSTSLLSMQTRVIDLRLLIWDFLGVFFLIGTLMMVSYALVRTLLDLKSWVNRDARSWKESASSLTPVELWKRKAKSAVSYLVWTHRAIYPVWLLCTVAFIVGMIYDVALGSRILVVAGTGVATLIFAGIAWTFKEF
jgi:hypothetical protein